GGPGSISPREVSSILKQSAPPRDTDLFFSKAFASEDGAAMLITATGEDLASVGVSNNYFRLSFTSRKPGQTLDSITINLNGTGLVFDPISHAPTVGSTTGPVITSFSPGTI